MNERRCDRCGEAATQVYNSAHVRDGSDTRVESLWLCDKHAEAKGVAADADAMLLLLAVADEYTAAGKIVEGFAFGFIAPNETAANDLRSELERRLHWRATVRSPHDGNSWAVEATIGQGPTKGECSSWMKEVERICSELKCELIGRRVIVSV